MGEVKRYTMVQRADLLRDADIPNVPAADGKNVSRASVKLILHAINNRAGDGDCRVSQDRLAMEAGVSVRTVGRAHQPMIDAGLVLYLGQWCFHRAIVHRLAVNWPMIETMQRSATTIDGRQPASSRSATDVATVGNERVDGRQLASPRSATSVATVGNGCRQTTLESDKLNQTTTSTTKEALVGEWLVLKDSLLDSGMIDAKAALMTARDLGWTIEGIEELRRCTSGRSPAVLNLWLKGDDRCALTPEEAHQRAIDRKQRKIDERRQRADAIRASWQHSGADNPVAVDGKIARELRANGFADAVTEAEAAAADQLDRWDQVRREREQEQPEKERREQPKPVLAPEPMATVIKQTSVPKPKAIVKRPPSRESVEQRRAQIERELAGLTDQG